MIHNDLYKISQTLKKQQKTHIFKRTVVICSTKTGEGVSVLLLVLLALFFMKRMTSRYIEGTIICDSESFGVGDEEIEFEDGAKREKKTVYIIIVVECFISVVECIICIVVECIIIVVECISLSV